MSCLFSSHSQGLTIEEIDLIFEEALQQHMQPKPKSKADIELENNPLFSKPVEDGRIRCNAPDCTTLVSSTNISRHWHKYHPNLERNDYQPSTRKLRKLLSDEVKGSNMKSIQQQQTSPFFEDNDKPCEDDAKAKLVDVIQTNGVYAFKCDVCDFTTQYSSNMLRHKRRRNHFTSTHGEESAEYIDLLT